MSDRTELPVVVTAGRVWTASLYAMLGLALTSGVLLEVLDPRPLSSALLALVVVLSVLTAWRGWGRVCDQITLTDSGIMLRTLWPRRSVALESGDVTRVWLSPNSGTIRFFSADTSYVLRIRGDLIDTQFERLLDSHLANGTLGHHYNKTLW